MPSSVLLRVSFQHGMVWNHKKSSSEIVQISPSGRSAPKSIEYAEYAET